MRSKINKGFGRISIPLVTPFKANEEVNYEAYKQLIEYVIKNKCGDSLISTGTTGEASALTFDERVKLFETAKEAINGRCVLMCGTGCASTYETIKLTKEAVRIGADYCLIVAPFYCKPNQEGIYRHYKKIAEETKAKIMLYNIPVFTGVNIEPETVARLAKIKNIIGIKDESGLNPNQILDYRLITKDINPDFIIFNGDDVSLLQADTLESIVDDLFGLNIFQGKGDQIVQAISEIIDYPELAEEVPVDWLA